MDRRVFLRGSAATAALVLLPIQARAEKPFTFELVCGMDVSSSVKTKTFWLQRKGLVQALCSGEVLSNLAGMPYGTMRMTVFEWGDKGEQKIILPPTVIYDFESASLFAAPLLTLERTFGSGMTDIVGAVEFAEGLYTDNNSTTKVLDLSGDGAYNTSDYNVDSMESKTIMARARDAAVGRGIVLNGLPIEGEQAGVTEYYKLWVIGGSGSFIEPAKDPLDFRRAIQRKLSLETSSLFVRSRFA